MTAHRPHAVRTLAALALLVSVATHTAQAQAGAQGVARRSQNVVLVMTDGLRWQELFGGADSTLLTSSGDSTALRRDFWRGTATERRGALLPFFWRTIATGGVLFGDSASGNVARVANLLRFSYPGYSETFTGFVDPRIDSNEYPPNPNVTVLEWLNRTGATRGRVAAYATWDAFTRIINAGRSGIPVHDGWERGMPSTRTPKADLLRALYGSSTRYWHNNTWDALMQQSMLEGVRGAKPRVLFVGYGETDEWAHGGRYDLYLRSARQFDRHLEELWTTLQADPQYRGTTTLLVTTDHGRGNGPRWRDHGANVVGADRIWIAALGPDTPATGIVRTGSVTQSQIAATIAALLGHDWRAAEPRAAPPLPGVAGAR